MANGEFNIHHSTLPRLITAKNEELLHHYPRDVPHVLSSFDEAERDDLDVVPADDDDDAAAHAHRAGREVVDADVVRALLQVLGPDDLGAEALGDVFVQLEAVCPLLVP